MKLSSKWFGTAIATLTAAAMLTGCGGGGEKKADAPKASGPSGEATIYTSMYPDILDKVCKPNVQKALPNLKTDWFQGEPKSSRPKLPVRSKPTKSAQTSSWWLTPATTST